MLRRFPWNTAQWFFFAEHRFFLSTIFHWAFCMAWQFILGFLLDRDFRHSHFVDMTNVLLLFYISCIFLPLLVLFSPAHLFSLMNRHKCRFIYTLPYDCKWTGNMKIEKTDFFFLLWFLVPMNFICCLFFLSRSIESAKMFLKENTCYIHNILCFLSTGYWLINFSLRNFDYFKRFNNFFTVLKCL